MNDADREVFIAAIGGLCIALREQKPDAIQLRVYFEALRDEEIEFVVAAAGALAKTAQFFPKPSEWRHAAMRVQLDRTDALLTRIRERLKAGQPPLCGVCNDTGWDRNEQTNCVKRCDCQRLRRLEILGRRPMPALPEASEPQEPRAFISNLPEWPK